ncbi:phosphatidylinositol-3,5-bisphosphate 5-phosphatase [Gryganskiella cystojenkinii]|nr:phosphatidylinositol-3,5-bisphosphate 5-phosphatase [Gryganskiella cystojenkinii]
MGVDQENLSTSAREGQIGIAAGMTATTTGASPLLPSHRFFISSAIKSSPFYVIPAHYLRRKGVLLVLVCMGLIAYVHYEYLMPSELLGIGYGGSSSDGNGATSRSSSVLSSIDFNDDDLSDEDLPGTKSTINYSNLNLGEIRERPEVGPAPVDGVDENGFEILEDDTDQESMSRKFAGPNNRPAIQFNAGGRHRETVSPNGSSKFVTRNKERQQFIKGMIQHAWTGYMQKAAPHDELRSVTGESMNPFHGWGATLIEAMDTLKLVGMETEYLGAKKFLDLIESHHWGGRGSSHARVGDDDDDPASTGDDDLQESTGHGQDIGFYESVVRYLGGLLSIEELDTTKDPRIMTSAINLADRLVLAFQGPNDALPSSRIFANGTVGSNAVLSGKISLAEVGTFQLEFRKLAQLTHNDKYLTLAQRNADFLASLQPRIPGLYPAYFDPDAGVGQEYVASFGSLSDSFYEYLLKSFILTGDVKFREQYITAVEAMHQYLISRPSKKSEPYLVLGVYDTATETLVPKMDHLSCFAPGLLALGSKVLGRPKDLTAARGLMETCFLSYRNSATGLGADEIAFLVTGASSGAGVGAKTGSGAESMSKGSKEFEMPQPRGFYVIDGEYGLRPETVESLFVMYRVTGDAAYQDYAWTIVQAIEKNCRTQYGYSTLANVMDASEGMTDRMPSHFLAQTLKYLYLIFSPPELVSLDEYLFTTEGHLMRYPIPPTPTA